MMDKILPGDPVVVDKSGEVQKYAQALTAARLSLGRELEPGEQVDLLLDNFEELHDSAAAREIVQQINSMPEFIFTFGYGYNLRNCFIAIRAPDEGKARHVMVEHYGLKWAFCYTSRDAAGVDRFDLTEVPLGTVSVRLY